VTEESRPSTETSKALRDFARAAGGALIFSLPMLMTMELWQLGFYLDRLRLFVLVITALPLLVLLSRYIGFEDTRSWQDDVFDALIALGVALLVCLSLLILFGVLRYDMPIDEIVGKVTLQMVPAAIGALLAKSQFRETDSDEDTPGREDELYGGELFLMGVGALFLGLNIAPTEETVLISFQISEWQVIGLIVLSLGVMHAFVFAVGFVGGSKISAEERWWSPFIRLTLPGYVIAMTVSLYLLWIFARLDDLSLEGIVTAIVVLSFPSAVGAAAARLVL
jgi:putative integral membrane protein (TIGR02587 family)